MAAEVAETGKTSAEAVSAGGNEQSEKELDSQTKVADTARPLAEGAAGTEWVEVALEKAGIILEAIPADAPKPVLPLFLALRDRLTDTGGGLEYATTPGDTPPEQFKAPKKAAVDNSVGARPGWKASVISRIKPLMDSMPLEAGNKVFEALDAFKKAVTSAKANDRDTGE